MRCCKAWRMDETGAGGGAERARARTGRAEHSCGSWQLLRASGVPGAMASHRIGNTGVQEAEKINS